MLTHDGASIVASRLVNKPYDKFGNIAIGDNVFIGIDSIILPGVTIGSNVIIGVGSVVTTDVNDDSIVAGVPARFICFIFDYIRKKSTFI